jgi:hypothetical protein
MHANINVKTIKMITVIKVDLTDEHDIKMLESNFPDNPNVAKYEIAKGRTEMGYVKETGDIFYVIENNKLLMVGIKNEIKVKTIFEDSITKSEGNNDEEHF